jgi:hypothetical protein
VKNYLSGVKTWSHILNFNIEAFSSSELKLTLRGLNNCNCSVRLKQYGVRLIKFDALNISKKAIVINDHKHASNKSYISNNYTIFIK